MMNYDHNKIFYSLNGFYKPEYDDLSPYEITQKYYKRKKKLATTKCPGKKTPYEKMFYDFACKNPNTIIGFFKDKQNKRYKNIRGLT